MNHSRSSAGYKTRRWSLLLATTLLSLGCFCPAALHAGLIQRVDATVAGSVITNVSGVVTSWLDQSGSGNSASSLLGTVSFPSVSLSASGEAGLVFGPTSREALQLLNASATGSLFNLQPGSSTNSGFAVLLAFKCDALTNNAVSDWNDLVGNGDEGSPANGFLMRYSSGGTLQAYLNGSFIQKSGSPTDQVAVGNTIVMAFNYNTNGSYEFWDSKSGTSMTGTKTATNFATGIVLKLGTTQNGNRYFKGMVGEVKLYNQVLSASGFKAEREQLAEKWANIPVNLPWRVIPADPNYPTEDLVIAALSVTDTAYLNNLLPADAANQDCTATFQEAINLVKNKGGGAVFVPAGQYRLDGRLDVPTGVSLRGRWQKPVAGQPIVGTILKAYAGRTNETSLPFIGLRGNSGVRDLAIWYPAQLPSDIQPYSPAIQGLSGGGFGVQNVTLVNTYVGFTTRLYEGGMGSSPFVRRVYGTPLKTGLEFDQLADVGRVETVHFSPAFWAGSGLATSPTSNQHAAWLRAHGTGVILRRIDWSYYAYVAVEGYNIGLACRPSLWDVSSPNGQCYRFDLTNCATGLYLEQSSYAGMQFTRFNIQNADVGVQCVDTNSTSVSLFQSCTIAATNWAVRNTSNATLAFQNSSFSQGGIKFDTAGDLSVLNCDFGATSSNHVELGASVEATLVGNRFVGGPKIANSSTKVVYVDHQPLALDALPPYEYGQPTNSFKPAQTNLYVVTLAPYSAAADGVTDDTAAFQAASSAAATAGGGTVFVPAGDYRLNGSLAIPTGVELRGVYDQPHGTSGRGSILNIYGGRNDASGTPFIQIQPSAGVRGLTFHYPEQLYNATDSVLGMVPYPFTLRGLGSNICVINVAATIPWQLLDLTANRCDNHYVDGIVAAALKTGVIVGNGSTDGKIMNCQLNPSQYGQSGGIYPSIPTSTYPDLFPFLNTNGYGYVLGKTMRQVFHQNFVFGALSGVLLADEGGSGPQGWSLGLGVDAGNKSLQVNQVDPGGFDCINNQLVSLTTQSTYLVTSNGFNTKLRLFGLACWGNPAKGAEANSGELQVQSGLIHHSTALTFDVNNTAKLTWQGGVVVTFANTLVQRDANATANFTGMSLNTATTQMPKTGTGLIAIGNLCRNTTPTPPGQPAGLSVATVNALVGLDWNDNAEFDINTYAVYRSTTSGSNYVQIATRLKASAYSDTNALLGVTYYYRVAAVDTCSAESAGSGQVAAQIYAPKLIQNLDASQPASVTTNGTGAVTSWADLSGNGNNAASLIGEVGYPSASLAASGLAGLAFGPTNREALRLLDASATAGWLNLQPGVAANSGFAVLVAFKCDALTNNFVADWNDLIGNGDEGSPANGFLMRYSSTGILQAYLNGSFIQKPGGSANQVAVGNTIVLAFNYNTNGNYQFWDSKSRTSMTGTKTATNFATGNGLRLGTTQNGSRYFKGMVGEVRLHNYVLDATTFGNERNALVIKWVQAPPTPTPTNITYTVAGGTVVFNWPNGAGWQLQAQTNGLSVGLNPAGNGWFNVTGTSPYTNNISATNPSVFFRLKWPAN